MNNLSMIVAIAQNNAIGKDNDLLWSLRSDLKRFKAITTGKNILMGKNTYESLPFRPLPNRKNFVISDVEVNYGKDVLVFDDMNEMIHSALSTGEESIIIGGGYVYSQTIDLVDTLYLTVVEETYEDATIFFPEFYWEEWDIIEMVKVETDNIPYTFHKLKRKYKD